MSVLVKLTWKKGKTWVAAIKGTDRKYGLCREWCSMQGKEGDHASYILGDGLYEAQDGKEPCQRQLFEVAADKVTVLTVAQLLAKLGGKPAREVKALTKEEEAETAELSRRKAAREELRRLRAEDDEAQYTASRGGVDYDIEAALLNVNGKVYITNEGGFHGD